MMGDDGVEDGEAERRRALRDATLVEEERMVRQRERAIMASARAVRALARRFDRCVCPHAPVALSNGVDTHRRAAPRRQTEHPV